MDITLSAIKNPEAFGLRVVYFERNRTDPQGLRWELIITMPPTRPAEIANTLRVWASTGGFSQLFGTIKYLTKDKLRLVHSQVGVIGLRTMAKQ